MLADGVFEIDFLFLLSELTVYSTLGGNKNQLSLPSLIHILLHGCSVM